MKWWEGTLCREELAGYVRQDSMSSPELGTEGADSFPGKIFFWGSFITTAADDCRGNSAFFFLAVR